VHVNPSPSPVPSVSEIWNRGPHPDGAHLTIAYRFSPLDGFPPTVVIALTFFFFREPPNIVPLFFQIFGGRSSPFKFFLFRGRTFLLDSLLLGLEASLRRSPLPLFLFTLNVSSILFNWVLLRPDPPELSHLSPSPSQGNHTCSATRVRTTKPVE